MELFADGKKKIARYEDLDEQTRLEYDFSFLEGVGAKLSGNLIDAMKWFDNCLKIHPNSPAVRHEIAALLLLAEDYNGALYMAREAVAGNPNNLWYKLLLANALEKKSMIEDAGKVYSEIITKYPDNEEYYLTEANLYVSIEKWQKAIDVLDRYEKQFGINELVSFEKIKLYTELDNTKKITAELTKLINNYPEKNEYLGLLAELYFSHDKEKKGLKIVKDILKKDPNNGYVNLFLADYYMKKKDLKAADTHTKAALVDDETDNSLKIQYILNLVFNYDSTQISNAQLNEYTNILMEKYSKDLPIRILHSDMLKKDKKYEEARDELTYILSQDASIYGAWEDLLLICNELMDTACTYAKSIEMIRYFPEQPLPYVMAGLGLVIRNDYRAAVETFERGLSLSEGKLPLKLQFLAFLGDCYYKLDSVEKAFQTYDSVLFINPGNVVVLNNYAYYLSLREEQLEKAEDMSYKAIRAEPENATYIDTYAWVLFKRKSYSQALYYMHRCIEKSEEPSGVLYEHYGDILYMNNEKDKALEMWKKAKEKGGDDLSENLDGKIDGTYKMNQD
ncbi:hypothetical protein FACS1894199_18720 [Bacteroidia bacterium]|nr:hypothetical protein FACS1894199_18720 [Bacteroidia bacterium]